MPRTGSDLGADITPKPILDRSPAPKRPKGPDAAYLDFFGEHAENKATPYSTK